MLTRELTPVEWDAALALVERVFMRFEAPEYPQEGVAAFFASLRDPSYLAQLRLYGAWDDDALVGVLATRASGRHIALFFVEESHQRRGVGKMLFSLAAAACPGEAMTVNASPYAVEIYRRLGFEPTGSEQRTNGIRYTPMKREP